MNISRLILLLVGTALSNAASSSAWEMNNYQDFIRGRFRGMSLSRDGRLMLAPKVDTIFDTGEQAVWATVRTADGARYLATGHRGKLYRIAPDGKKTMLWASSQPEIFALAADGKGTVFAATSPDGKIYRIESGKAVEYFETNAKFVWSLAFDSAGRLLAGTEPNGILYRITTKEKAFVLYDANLPEIRAIVPASDGSVYVAALGGSLAGRGGVLGTPVSINPATTPVQGAGTTITITEEAAAIRGVPTVELPKPEQNQKQPQTPPQQASVTSTITSMTELSGVEKSAIYRIHPDNTVETLWSSKEENVFALVRVGDYLLFGTDVQGRLYRLSADRKVTLLSETNEATITKLTLDGTDLVATTTDQGKLLSFGNGFHATGEYETPVHDAGAAARWGRFDWRAEMCANCTLKFQTRSGNSARPDRTWSEWEDVTANQISSPNARFLQWHAMAAGTAENSPVLDSVSASYLPQNTAPTVRSITLSLQAASSTSTTKAQAAQAASQPSYSVTVTDSADPLPTTSSGSPSQILSRGGAQSLLLSWQAEDSDGDKLVYAAYFRGEGEREWKLLKANMAENSLLIDADSLADGRYLFRIVASDRLMNPAASARQSELISTPFLIDNTPPVVTIAPPVRQGEGLEVSIEVADATSPIRRAEYSIDAGPWTPLEAVDGILDSQRERIELKLDKLAAGEHLLAVRAYDAAGNAGLGKVIIR